MKLKNLYFFCKKKFPYLFPGRILAFFAEEWKEERLYFTGLSAVEKQEIKKSRRRHGLSFSFSCILHGVLFIGLYNGLFTPVKEGPVLDIGEAGAVDFELAEGMISSEMSPVFYESDIVVKPALLFTKKKKDERKTALEALLQELKLGKNPLLSSSVSADTTSQSARLEWEERRFKAGLLSVKAGKRKRKHLKAQLWSKMNLFEALASSSDVSVNNSDIMKVIDGHSFQFRHCYERALLKDESLSVKVVFLLKLSQSRVKTTRLEIKGTGSPPSRRILSHCLFRESKKLTFVNNTENISLKFNLIFGL